MIVKNAISSFIGVWFLLTPWMFGLTASGLETYLCFILGGIQCLFSLLAISFPGGKSWLNGLPLFIGIWFIIFPNAFNLPLLQIVVLEVLGLATILINYALLFPESQ
ncbi:SPW repeat domain-containing protein [Paenibacillus piri]|uniref:SPW repeat-containing integral membrane domain-containing protein n=1 Tax=Paenibacillus piri TaxID=2547395 RepID=A0A4R5KR26_9BACL|nr:hypothetical protein [Paenibacillus piri]TDF98243.1 hypothetical protein E1757_12160 [Paenibacillus piri]